MSALIDQSDQSTVTEYLRRAIHHHLTFTIGVEPEQATPEDKYGAVAHAIREYAMRAMAETEGRYRDAGAKRVYYLSMEFLIGRLLKNNLVNLGILDACEAAAKAEGLELADLMEFELDPALGNGGLGRLAACFLDSMATLGIAGYGYGINYEFGLFKQSFVDGFQREHPDHWMSNGTPWYIERRNQTVQIPVYGRVEHTLDQTGNYQPVWLDWQSIMGIPYDMPVVGYDGAAVNYLRLYSAQSSSNFEMNIFNQGDYIRAVEQKIQTETVSKVLYPSDEFAAGQELRFVQEYFFVACALRDIVQRHKSQNGDIRTLADHAAIQLNDTHPALAVPELMRMLLDEFSLDWDSAWDITTNTLAYTNHTLLPEALERWPVDLFARVLPRHIEIVYEINQRFLDEVRKTYPGDEDRVRRMSIVEEGDRQQIRMAYLSIVGSHAVNGVAALHSELVKANLVPEFNEFYPGKFQNKTNGVTQRRWLLSCNPGLSSLITDAIGPAWITDLDRLRDLEDKTGDSGFLDALHDVKLANKTALANYIKRTTRIDVDPTSLFDVQIKRIHEYKRQLLNALHIAHLYLAITEDGLQLASPRTFVFSGKAAPGYHTAKLIIKLINNIGRTVNSDPRVNNQLRVAFVPDYKVSVAERIIPAADLSEQISTAGYEASGTGNMKLSMNGALTIGTLDGANVEIREEVGEDNIFIFGLTTDEVADLRREGYNPYDWFDRDERIRRVLEAIAGNAFSRHEPGLFAPMHDLLLAQGDYYLNLADFGSYVDCQKLVDAAYADQPEWRRLSLLNIARTGKFSSDRTISEYAREIWGVQPG
ncbi:MAG: glycogen/starch/alpha-glucan phosphorylase [Pseudomonadota bacterium]